MQKLLLSVVLCCLLTHIGMAQNAELRIKNNSARSMTVKIMNKATNRLYKRVELSAYDESTTYFVSTGQFYCKTEARMYGREPIYEKGNAFRVYVGDDGYSVLTISFSVSESSQPDVLGGNRISKSEFDKN